jgi:restriction system protein
MFARDPTSLLGVNPRDFEALVAASYDAAGFDEVVLTPRSGDEGRDVIATKRGFFSVRIVDQCKAFRPGHKVTANDVRALVGTLIGDRAVSKGVVTTTSTFAPGIATDSLLAPLMPTRLELVDGEAFVRRCMALTSKR